MTPTNAVVVLVPVFNDWDSFQTLIERLDDTLSEFKYPVHILVIDDGSTTPLPDRIRLLPLRHIQSIDILRLRRNLGHQRALAVGLCYVESELGCRAVIIMDGDGEDSPGDIPRLFSSFEQHGEESIVFAERFKRSEGLLFRLGYHSYRLLHRLLTGYAVRVGNFSVIPYSSVSRLVVTSELWNHYAATVFRSRIPYVCIPTARGKRFHGRSRMDFVALVTHGLSAIAVFSDIVGVRLLLTSIIFQILIFACLIATVPIRVFTDFAIPGWATFTVGLLVVVLVQMATLFGGFVFLTLSGRSRMQFLPIREFSFFVDGVHTLWKNQFAISSASNSAVTTTRTVNHPTALRVRPRK